MKLSPGLFAAVVSAGYSPPTFRELMAAFKGGFDLGSDGQRALAGQQWGQPIGRAYLKHDKCPALATPEGADNVVCDQASCAVECKGGYSTFGAPRTKCKRGRNGVPNFWQRQLSGCTTCVPMPSLSGDLWKSCWVNNRNQKVCQFGCKNGGELKNPKHNKVECKCKKSQKTCKWTVKSNEADWSTFKCVGAKIPADGVACNKKPKQCLDVTSQTELMNSWTCRNCFRMRTNWKLSDFFDNRDHLVMNFNEPVQIQNFAHPMKEALNPSGDLKTWFIVFSEEAQFGDRRLDFTTEWRYFEKPARLMKSQSCPCSKKIV